MSALHEAQSFQARSGSEQHHAWGMVSEQVFKSFATVIAAFSLVAALVLALQAQWYDALAVAGLSLVALLVVSAGKKIPRIFTLLLLGASLINVGGYAFELWRDPPWFDEAAHAYTSFAVSAVVGWILMVATRAEERLSFFAAAIFAIGILIGILWEIIEWAAGIIGSLNDTLIDLGMDALGAAAAATFCALLLAGRSSR